MFLRVRLQNDVTGKALAKSIFEYPVRSFPFLTSLGLHLTAIALLGTVSIRGAHPAQPADENVIHLPNKIIYYDFRKPLPDVGPSETASQAAPSGAHQSRQTVIASAPRARSQEQLVWIPMPKIELPKDTALPDMIAGTPTPSAPPPPAKPKPRAFVPPSTAVRAQTPNQVYLIDGAPTLAAPSLPVPLAPGMAANTALPAAPAPPRNQGNADADVAVANLHPVEAARGEIPEGSRSGQFSKAPNAGAPAPGGASGNAVAVPNLTVREDRAKPAPAPDPATRPIIYSEKVRSVSTSTLSVPLRPSSRMLPRSLEGRFHGRNVYTMVVPIENFPAYAGDWIIWFAERDAKPNEAPLVRAPLPSRKLEAVERTSLPAGGLRAQIAATITHDGKLTEVTLLTPAAPAVAQAIVQDISAWEFRPATRLGAAIDVDAVIEIPFQSLPALPSAGGR